ncbi:hypothetical protein DFH27DRAFT_529580 [Peziza echinospora]|nr:hypothetical protein DFH27DRAFT_529580 [Peziza echinospora]
MDKDYVQPYPWLSLLHSPMPSHPTPSRPCKRTHFPAGPVPWAAHAAAQATPPAPAPATAPAARADFTPLGIMAMPTGGTQIQQPLSIPRNEWQILFDLCKDLPSDIAGGRGKGTCRLRMRLILAGVYTPISDGDELRARCQNGISDWGLGCTGRDTLPSSYIVLLMQSMALHVWVLLHQPDYWTWQWGFGGYSDITVVRMSVRAKMGGIPYIATHCALVIIKVSEGARAPSCQRGEAGQH